MCMLVSVHLGSASAILIILYFSLLAFFQGWEVTMIKQESSDGPLELQLALPSMPSLYVISFFYLACLEIHRIGGHILDRTILQNFSWELLDKVSFP